MFQDSKYSREEFIKFLIENRRDIDYINNKYYSNDHKATPYIIWVDSGDGEPKGFLLHSRKRNLAEMLEVIAQYSKIKGYIEIFADEEITARLRKYEDGNLDEEEDEDEIAFISNYFNYTNNGYIKNILFVSEGGS